jgi:toxin ParE1/3/4
LTPLRVHQGARRERLHARGIYARRDPAVAVRFDAALRAVFDRIKEQPTQFAEHGLLAVQLDVRPLFFSVRRALLPKPFPYVVFYYLRENVVVVLAIAHARRRPGYWFERS